MPRVLIVALICAAACFVMQMLFCFGARRRRWRMAPIWFLCAAWLAVLVYWLTGLGGYDYGSIISAREVKSLVFAVSLLGAAAGDGLAWLVWRSSHWRTR